MLLLKPKYLNIPTRINTGAARVREDTMRLSPSISRKKFHTQSIIHTLNPTPTASVLACWFSKNLHVCNVRARPERDRQTLVIKHGTLVFRSVMKKIISLSYPHTYTHTGAFRARERTVLVSRTVFVRRSASVGKRSQVRACSQRLAVLCRNCCRPFWEALRRSFAGIQTGMCIKHTRPSVRTQVCVFS
jgi:hypothetical protein